MASVPEALPLAPQIGVLTGGIVGGTVGAAAGAAGGTLALPGGGTVAGGFGGGAEGAAIGAAAGAATGAIIGNFIEDTIQWFRDRAKPECKDKPRDCAKEWEEARQTCAELLSRPNPPRGLTGGYRDIENCARGFVSEECRGNPIDRGRRK
jgi:hypothetical protein